MNDYTIHLSHEPVDISDLSLTVDIICDLCHKTDEQLIEPCDKNPWWDTII